MHFGSLRAVSVVGGEYPVIASRSSGRALGEYVSLPAPLDRFDSGPLKAQTPPSVCAERLGMGGNEGCTLRIQNPIEICPGARDFFFQ